MAGSLGDVSILAGTNFSNPVSKIGAGASSSKPEKSIKYLDSRVDWCKSHGYGLNGERALARTSVNVDYSSGRTFTPEIRMIGKGISRGSLENYVDSNPRFRGGGIYIDSSFKDLANEMTGRDSLYRN